MKSICTRTPHVRETYSKTIVDGWMDEWVGLVCWLDGWMDGWTLSLGISLKAIAFIILNGDVHVFFTGITIISIIRL